MSHAITRPRAMAPLAVAFAVALALAGCAADAPVAPPADAPPTATAPTDSPAETDAPVDAPDAEPDVDSPLAFTAVDLAGAHVDLAELTGEPVVLWFWAPWCSICRGEGPHVADVAAALDGAVTFVGVAGLGERAAMEAFVADTNTGGFVHLVDDDGSLWQRFGVTYQPAYAFIDTTGAVSVLTGALGPDELAERAEALI